MNKIFRFLNQPIIKHHFIRTIHDEKVHLPNPGTHCFWKIIHYPKEYTVKPIDTTNLSGCDPKSGKQDNVIFYTIDDTKCFIKS